METLGSNPVSANRTAVIIPFFQREPGLLLRAVRSVLGQSAGSPLVIVVDDASPVGATQELSVLSPEELGCVTVITQRNAGPGAARNAGLSAVPPHIDYIAFLDSDDEWLLDHLARALGALSRGADFYFADHLALLSKHSHFASCGFQASDPVNTPNGDGTFTYGGNFFDAILRRSPVGTSTVVYRKSIGVGKGFPVHFSYGEDAFFWVSLASKGTTIMFSPTVSVVYGKGVNIAASGTWGNPAILPKLMSEYLFHEEMVRTFRMTAAQTAWSKAYRKEIARSFNANLVHLALRRKQIDWSRAIRFFLIQLRPAARRDLAGG